MRMVSSRGTTAQICRGARCAIAAALLAVLAACSSPTEKANRFYEKGVVLLKEGDTVKARIEFQNALQIKGDMAAAWYGLAQIAERNREWPRLFALLNNVLERDPNHLEAHLKLARLLLASGKLDKALSESDITLTLAKDSPAVLAVRASILFKLEDKPAALAAANAALTKEPNNIDALVVLASERLAAGDANAAIEYLDRGIKADEKNIALQLIKVQAFESIAKLDSAEEIYRKLISLYPEIRALRHILAQFYLAHKKPEMAEAEYRKIAADNPKDVSAQIDLIRFIGGVKGPKAALGELEALIQKEPDRLDLRFALVGLFQAQGDRKAVDAALKSIIEKAGETPEGLRAKSLLAASALDAGDPKSAQALVAEVLAKDQRQDAALLLRATMAITDRKFDQAIVDLRTILRDAPNAASALVTIAKAHELSNAFELAQENYLKSFQASRQNPMFGMAYAEYLTRRNQAARAEGVAEDILRTTPGYVPALKLLAQAKLSKGDFAGAQRVSDSLAKLDNAGQASDQVRGAVLAAQKNYAESIAAFRRAYDAAPTEVQPMVSLVRTYVLAGKTAEALAFVNSVLRASPNNMTAMLLQAQLYANGGDNAAAGRSYQAVIGQSPKDPIGYANLAALRLKMGKPAEAAQAVEQGLAAIPNDFNLRLTQASIYETSGRIDDAIALYEQLIKERPNSDVVANNLASLLADHRTDKASLTRARELAQRFSRSEIPQFKDTLGWAQLKSGKPDEAVQLIADASKQLPDIAVFRYHLGMSYLAQNKKDAARKELERALSLGEKAAFPEMELARQALKGL